MASAIAFTVVLSACGATGRSTEASQPSESSSSSYEKPLNLLTNCELSEGGGDNSEYRVLPDPIATALVNATDAAPARRLIVGLDKLDGLNAAIDKNFPGDYLALRPGEGRISDFDASRDSTAPYGGAPVLLIATEAKEWLDSLKLPPDAVVGGHASVMTNGYGFDHPFVVSGGEVKAFCDTTDVAQISSVVRAFADFAAPKLAFDDAAAEWLEQSPRYLAWVQTTIEGSSSVQAPSWYETPAEQRLLENAPPEILARYNGYSAVGIQLPEAWLGEGLTLCSATRDGIGFCSATSAILPGNFIQLQVPLPKEADVEIRLSAGDSLYDYEVIGVVSAAQLQTIGGDIVLIAIVPPDTTAVSMVDIRKLDLAIAFETRSLAELQRLYPPAPTLPVLDPYRSRRLSLRAVFPDDVPFAFHLISNPDIATHWRFQGAIPDPLLFGETFRQGVLTQFIVERRLQNTSIEKIGHVVAYAANERSGFCYFGGAFLPKVWNTGLPIEGLLLFLVHLFTIYPFRKIYAEMEESNFDRVSSGRGRLFEVEGVLTQHLYVAGRYRDTYLLSFSRAQFLAVVSKDYSAILESDQRSSRTA